MSFWFRQFTNFPLLAQAAVETLNFQVSSAPPVFSSAAYSASNVLVVPTSAGNTYGFASVNDPNGTNASFAAFNCKYAYP